MTAGRRIAARALLALISLFAAVWLVFAITFPVDQLSNDSSLLHYRGGEAYEWIGVALAAASGIWGSAWTLILCRRGFARVAGERERTPSRNWMLATGAFGLWLFIVLWFEIATA